jgi:hypothetical protein
MALEKMIKMGIRCFFYHIANLRVIKSSKTIKNLSEKPSNLKLKLTKKPSSAIIIKMDLNQLQPSTSFNINSKSLMRHSKF